MGAFWKPWAPFLDFLASLENIKIQREKGRPKRSPKGPGVSVSIVMGEVCRPYRESLLPPERTKIQTQTRPRPEPRPGPDPEPEPEPETERENRDLERETDELRDAARA